MPVKNEVAKIGALAPWFGAKRTLSSRIVSQLGPHRAYWEPFCGSMAVLLAKPVATMETVNDLHGDLVNLARTVQGEETAVELYARLNRTFMSEEVFKEQAAMWKAEGRRPAGEAPDVDRAFRFFLCSWMGMNGVAGTQSYNQGFCARYTKNGGHAAKRFHSAVESIPWWHERLRTVTILNRDGFDLLERIEDAAGVVIYCDPPYLAKGAKYVHDFTSDDHKRLARLLDRFQKTRVVVSYYEHPELDSLYPEWKRIPCETAKALVNSGKRDGDGATVAPETLLLNLA